MFRAFITPQEIDRGYRRTEIVAGPAGPIEVHVMGEGPTVVLLPSLGRGAADFQALAARLARAGFQVETHEIAVKSSLVFIVLATKSQIIEKEKHASKTP